MRPVPPRSAARCGAAVPSARSWLPVLGSRCRAVSSVTGLGSVSTSAARTCRRSQPIRGRAHGAMTAALVIVPADPVSARPVSAQRGRVTGSPVAAVSPLTRPGPREVPIGAPWTVRLSMARGDLVSPVRLAPARKRRLGPTAA